MHKQLQAIACSRRAPCNAQALTGSWPGAPPCHSGIRAGYEGEPRSVDQGWGRALQCVTTHRLAAHKGVGIPSPTLCGQRHVRCTAWARMQWQRPRGPLARQAGAALGTHAVGGGPVQERMAFLEDDLQHLFDDQGIDTSAYENVVDFLDPLTKLNSAKGYMANINMLRKVCC